MSGYLSIKHMRKEKKLKIVKYVKTHKKMSSSVVAAMFKAPVQQVNVIKAHISMGHKI